MSFQKELENLMQQATGMIDTTLTIYKKMGQEFVENGQMTQLEFNALNDKIQRMAAMQMDPERRQEANDLKKQIDKEIEDLMKSKTEKD